MHSIVALLYVTFNLNLSVAAAPDPLYLPARASSRPMSAALHTA